MKHALVVGATGVIGGAIARELASSGKWHVTCVTRAGTSLDGCEGVAVDIMDEAQVTRAASNIRPVTHLFFAAYQSRPNRFEEIEPNVTMLRHAIDLAEARSLLERVVLITGGKYYGVQWGAIKTPARETDPRHLGPNFYYNQQDYLEQRAAAAQWSWTNLVPPYVTGFSERSPMNLVMAIAVLATLSRESGVPLRFPGPTSAWNSLHHLADANVIADAAHWAAEAPTAANEMFNIANGDPGRWRYVWPTLADFFGLDTAEPLPVPLQQLALCMQGTWQKIAERYALRQPDITKLVDWKWADYMFNSAFCNDVVLELGKIRRAGFNGSVSAETALEMRFRELREKKLIP
ncbi:SDR family oxidoreductase [Burkholderia sp. SCN-KJ]|uniref:SDR family oxidoreductase n=1 Tax=Burkholderia sp. SCN-KJ TaxID=2969248 RepID=UPI00214FBDAA|nr:SDR family oxidoreductase [Burkholderia sp. SCN-KJ]MCR4470429.1 SDR family oxidoreductase [Burkholderia sp. SCN-KJ]